ncbi:helix-turn-helix transcriptional regulator [Candidatus Cetobacterium colombiensis]|uniref:PAS domain-containing protein n=1 Tax=Candidatus Cetobacterium colombiensis TaxID=3073100 RepID=A0ABU4W9I7_9FUSO|nr:PAS domain-containing protein [Candidatus Cetobacterium colombiensis]MDX8335869.1 PAS domain-containing protein [Candidatus Cetobacterium colombiensis]
MKGDLEILEEYRKVAKFMSKCYGENVEVVLHDLRDVSCSSIEIFNNHVSGREIGSPMSEFGLKILKEKLYEDKEFITNSKGVVGGKILRSSTFFIKNSEEEIIGMVCVNVDVSVYLNIAYQMENMANFGLNLKDEKEIVAEVDFPNSVKEMINKALLEILKGKISWKEIDGEGKLDVIKKLNQKGIFDLRGGVSEVSEILKVSESTIYRYLSKI